MLRLNAGFSRKIGEPNYGSRGASVNVELEVESNLIGDPDALLGRIRNLFDLARRSVDQELASANNGGHEASPRSDRGNVINDRQPVRYATQSQQRAIRAICKRLNRDADQLAHEQDRLPARGTRARPGDTRAGAPGLARVHFQERRSRILASIA